MANSKYWNEKVETMSVQDLRKHQLGKLKEQVKHCYNNSAFYQKKFKAAGLKPDDIKTLEDIQKIPFTVKNDLRDNYPLSMLSVKHTDIVEIHASSGTTGNPIIGAYTKSDMDAWQELMARSIYTTGGRKDDVIHRLRLRLIHRRVRLPLWRSENRNHDRSREWGNDAAPDKTHEGPRRHSALLHSELRSLSC